MEEEEYSLVSEEYWFSPGEGLVAVKVESGLLDEAAGEDS